MQKYFLSLLLVLAAGLILLSNLNVGNFSQILSNWWPIFLIGAGVLMAWSNRQNLVWSTLLTILGVLFLFNNLSDIQINISDIILPLVLLGLAASVIFGGKRSQNSDDSSEQITVILGGTERKNHSQDFKEMSITAFAGGADVDLRKVEIKKEAYINVNVLMGGIGLQVPEDVEVRSRATCILGGIEDKATTSFTKDKKVLYIDGTVVMGGMEIKR